MTRRYRKLFAERNRVVIAVVGLAALIATFFLTFYSDSLPMFSGEEHQAYFAEAGGLRPGDEVRIAGVRAGEVTDLELDGAAVLVTFRVKDVSLGTETTAAVRVKTLLGQKYLAVLPAGTEDLDAPIQVTRTTTPYDVNAAFSDLASTVGEIDTKQLEQSLRALATAFEDTPESMRGMIDGLTRLSRTIASRDKELATLLGATKNVTGTLAERTDEIGKLITDGESLLTELAARRAAVGKLLKNTREFGTEIRGLVKDNQRQLKPALDKLDKVSAILQRNQKRLDQAMNKLGPYYRMLATAMGNGPWADTYICGLFDEHNVPVLDDDVLRDCNPGGK